MKTIRLINDDYLGHFEHLRHACRGIVVKDDKVLLSYAEKASENRHLFLLISISNTSFILERFNNMSCLINLCKLMTNHIMLFQYNYRIFQAPIEKIAKIVNDNFL